MPGFRRARLHGSDELFRPTQRPGEQVSASQTTIEVAAAAVVGVAESGPSMDTAPPPPSDEEPNTVVVPSVPAADEADAGRPPAEKMDALDLTPEEIHLLADAVQRLKFPQKATGRPSVDEFERLESLRQKLLASL